MLERIIFLSPFKNGCVLSIATSGYNYASGEFRRLITQSVQAKFSVRGDTKCYCKYPDLAAILAAGQAFLRRLLWRT